jgi:hypothetical protein
VPFVAPDVVERVTSARAQQQAPEAAADLNELCDMRSGLSGLCGAILSELPEAVDSPRSVETQ